MGLQLRENHFRMKNNLFFMFIPLEKVTVTFWGAVTISAFIVYFSVLACAEEPRPITEKQLAEITQSLKNVLDENRELADLTTDQEDQSRLREENERLKNVIQDFKVRLDDVISRPPAAVQVSGEDYSQMKLSEKAGLAASKTSELKQDTADIYFQMAEEAFTAGLYKEALEHYRKCLALNPDSDLTSRIQGRIQSAQTMLAEDSY